MMMDRIEALSGHVDALIRQHRAAKAEIARLTRALHKAELARIKVLRETETVRRDALHSALAALPVAEESKPALRRSLDAVISEIDTILMQLHD